MLVRPVVVLLFIRVLEQDVVCVLATESIQVRCCSSCCSGCSYTYIVASYACSQDVPSIGGSEEVLPHPHAVLLLYMECFDGLLSTSMYA
jgi:hypothetical protein